MDWIEVAVQHFWRPWEDEQEDPVTDERILVSPTKPYFSFVTSSPAPRPTPSRVYRRIWKRKRSPGELQRRQQRLFAYQNTSSPCITEPEQLESGSWEGGRNCSELGDRYYGGGGYSYGTQQDEKGYVERNSNSYNTTVLSPPPPQNWLQPCWAWAPTPSPGPSTTTCQPASPVYCDGCHSWGNLLAVTVTQARGL